MRTIDELLKMLPELSCKIATNPFYLQRISMFCKELDNFDVKCFIAKEGKNGIQTLRVLIRNVIELKRDVLLNYNAMVDLFTRGDESKPISDIPTQEAVLDFWRNQLDYYKGLKEQGLSMDYPFRHGTDIDEEINTTDVDEAISVIENIIADQKSTLELLNHSDINDIFPTVKELASKLTEWLENVQKLINEYIEEEKSNSVFSKIDFSSILPDILDAANEYEIFTSQVTDESLGLFLSSFNGLRIAKKSFVFVMVKFISEKFLRKVYNGTIAHQWLNDAINKLGLSIQARNYNETSSRKLEAFKRDIIYIVEK